VDAQHAAYDAYLTAYYEGPKTVEAQAQAAYDQAGAQTQAAYDQAGAQTQAAYDQVLVPAYDGAFAAFASAEQTLQESNPCGPPAALLPTAIDCVLIVNGSLP
jgi:hypothetical protein